MAHVNVPDHVVELIVRLRRDNALSYRRICAHLTRKRIPPPRAATWSAMTVRNIYVRATALTDRNADTQRDNATRK
jgi:hypothetical protein